MEVNRPSSSPDRGSKPSSAPTIAWRWVGVLALGALTVWLVLRGMADNRLHVYFLDVGQGDAILVRAPDGRTILIDGGPSPAALLNEIGEVLPFWDRSLDLVVLTHPDQDHLTGLIPLLDRYRIGQVLDVVEPGRGPYATLWLEAVTESEVPRTSAGRGARLPVGQLQVMILNPERNPTMDATRDDNSGSIVLRLDYGQTSALLAGDADQQAEDDMLTAGLPLAADVLKVGHHGSKFSSSAAFLAAVSPRVAVIQVGADNPFGHPDLEVLARLAGSQVFRTDQKGRIDAISDGVRWRIETER
jgi:competence protein ComEC